MSQADMDALKIAKVWISQGKEAAAELFDSIVFDKELKKFEAIILRSKVELQVGILVAENAKSPVTLQS